MACILASVYMGRYPLGGNLSFNVQWVVGLHRLGHDVHLLEKANYTDAWFLPVERRLSDEASNGFKIVERLLRRFGLPNRYTAVDVKDQWYGGTPETVRELFRRADLLIDLGNHGAWLEQADSAGLASLRVDGEPGMTQIRMEQARRAGSPEPAFTYYYTNGANIGSSRSTVPSAGVRWRHVFNPVVSGLFSAETLPVDGPFTTVMNWQSHAPVHFDGRSWGQKDVEFQKFLPLPHLSKANMEIAVAGVVPVAQLKSHGWSVRDGHYVTRSLGAFNRYLHRSLAEFGVCKQMFVGPRTGWFSDRSAAYLAAGRPVILQDSGFSDHLPTGRGLFAVNTVEEAAEAVSMVRSDPQRQSRWARDVAREYLDAEVVLPRLFREIGL
jgi:hypothetical protein